MPEVVKTRTIRPESRSPGSKNYSVDISKVNTEDTLTVNVNHSKTNFHHRFVFNGKDLANRESISFRVEESDGIINIVWSKVTPSAIFLMNENKSRKSSTGGVYYRQDRLFRLTYNTNGWTTPSGHSFNPANQGNTDIAFENQFGFGGEEWLFNSNFQQDNMQYGYIRGAEELGNDDYIRTAYLFTIEKISGERYLVGKINNLLIINDNHEFKTVAKKLIDKYFTEMKVDLEQVGADKVGLIKTNFVSNVCFNLEDINLFTDPILISGLKGQKYNRFKPYILNDKLNDIISGVIPEDKFIFRPGIAKNTKFFTRTSKGGVNTVERIHSEITNKLVEYLSVRYSLNQDAISVEKTSFGANLADVVIKELNDEHTIFEIKTSNNSRKNIREAIGQLIDYAFWYDDIKIKSLIIVAPGKLKVNEQQLLKRIKKSITLNVVYWQYLNNNISGSNFEPIII